MISIINLTSTTGSTVNVVADCLSGTNATSTAHYSQAVTLPPGGTTPDVLVKCPTGTILSGGGYNGGIAFQPNVNAQWFTGWQVVGKNHNNFQPTSFTAQAVCLSGVSGGSYRAEHNNQKLAAGQEVRIDANLCPVGTLLSMGGFRNFNTVYARGSHRSFQDSTKWSSTFVNQSTQDAWVYQDNTCLELWQ